MSTAHVVSRSLRDTAALLDATHGPDLGAPYFAPEPERAYLDELSRAPGRLRIARADHGVQRGRHAPGVPRRGARRRRSCAQSLGHEVVRGQARGRPRGARARGAGADRRERRGDRRGRGAAAGREVGSELVEEVTFVMMPSRARGDRRGLRARGARDPRDGPAGRALLRGLRRAGHADHGAADAAHRRARARADPGRRVRRAARARARATPRCSTRPGTPR